jgi:Fe-S cluster assembly protein SufD
MTDLLSRPNFLVENYPLVRDLLATFGPESLRERREAAFRAFELVGLPTMKDEEFKYLSLRTLEETRFAPAYGAFVERPEVALTPLGELDAITVTFVNGQHSPELSSEDVLPEGVVVSTLAAAFETLPDVVEQHLGKVATLEGKLGSTNDERFVHLNTAYLGEGAFVYVPKGVAVERPIHLQFLTKADHGPLATFPRVLVVLEENAQAKLVESYVGLGGKSFTNSVTEVVLAKYAILEHTRFNRENAEGVHISTTSAHQEGDSNYTHNGANLGGQIVRNDVNIWSAGEHTETSLNAANVGTGEQVVDNHTRIDHATPNCHSFETYKSILRDRAVGVFNGKIFVYEDAQKTDAKQTNQAILLSGTATMNTKPQLEIFADDVKCTHGATIGQLREDALFYLRARGVPKEQAQALLVYAFAAEVLEKISIDGVREALEKVLFQRLAETEALPETEE